MLSFRGSAPDTISAPEGTLDTSLRGRSGQLIAIDSGSTPSRP